MKQPQDQNSGSSISDETKLSIVLVSVGIGILLLITLVALLLAGRLSFPSAQAGSPPVEASQPAAPVDVPTLFIPTPDCGAPTLLVGETQFQVQVTQPGADGTVSVPPNTNGIAYWVEGTDGEYIFLLSPTPENLSFLTSLPPGTLATATWSNCNSMTFALSDPQPGVFEIPGQPGSSTASLAIYVQDSTGQGVVVRGELGEEIITVLNSPMPDESGVLAEVGLVEVAAEGNTVRLTVSVYNFGGEPFTLTGENVSLTPPGAAPLAIDGSSPRLPEKIDPAETETFTFTFPRPSTPTATLRVFTVEYDVEGY